MDAPDEPIDAAQPEQDAAAEMTAEQLEAFRHRFRPFQAAPTAVLLADEAGRILMANERLEKVFGYAPGELIGNKVETLTPPETRARHAELREAFVEYPVTRRMGAARDLFGVAKDGRRIPVEIGLTTVEANGRCLTLAFVLDLTERRRQEEKFRLIAEAAANGLLLVDARGRIALVNGPACTIFGYEPEELIDKPIETLLPERYRTKHGVYRASYSDSPEPRSMGRGRDLFARRKGGDEFPVEIGLTPLDSHDGHYTVATVIDITERKRVEREIHLKNELLSSLNDELTNFAYGVSHDLKAPLASIRGLADAAIEDLDGAKPSEAGESLARIQREAEHLGNVVESVLSVAAADHVQQIKTAVSLANLIGEVLDTLQPFAAQSSVRLVSRARSDLHATADPGRLRQVLENLISNGIKYCDHAKDERYVEVSTDRADSRVVLTVSDNGLGIPTDCHSQVFGMFKRFHSGGLGGSGLGLALVKKHVDRMGGEIGFSSSSDGTRFRVLLPDPAEDERC